MGEDTAVYIGDRFNATEWNDGFWTEKEYKGTILDSHYYHGTPRPLNFIYFYHKKRDLYLICFFLHSF